MATRTPIKDHVAALLAWTKTKDGEPPNTCPAIDKVLESVAGVTGYDRDLSRAARDIEDADSRSTVETVASGLGWLSIEQEMEAIRAANDWLRRRIKDLEAEVEDGVGAITAERDDLLEEVAALKAAQPAYYRRGWRDAMKQAASHVRRPGYRNSAETAAELLFTASDGDVEPNEELENSAIIARWSEEDLPLIRASEARELARALCDDAPVQLPADAEAQRRQMTREWVEATAPRPRWLEGCGAEFEAFHRYDTAVARTMATAPGDTSALAHWALGLAGEAGEVCEPIKKHCFNGRALDRDALAAELGDVLWYLSALAQSIGSSLAEVAAKNVAKLEARYPDGYVPGGGKR